ncbi:MAG: 2-hydroxyacyl-CoA dehydratase family protein, partial [Chloroflexota bacterium]|nr:2-hydroxyacyl-CoA dehydratase family protein [Chloroflexota bacterium]
AVPDLAYDDPEVEKRYVEHEKGQLQTLIAFLQKHTGRKVRWDDVSEAIVKHHQARDLWHDIYELRKAVPCPVPVGDTASCMFPLYYMMGTQEGLDYYRKFHDEVAHRVAHKIGVIPNEKYRLLWGGIPQWHNLGFFNALESSGAVFAVDTQPYRDAFIEVDPSNPIEAIAKRNFGDAAINAARARRLGGVGDSRAGLILELCRDHHVDGAVLHSVASCRPVAIGWIHVSRLLKEHLGIPALPLESDIADTRAYSEAQTKEQVAAFIEMVDTFKRQRQ